MATIMFKGNPVHTVGELPKVGGRAPGFRLTRSDLSDVTLAELAGKKKLLNIVPSLDTGVCAASTRRFNEEAAKVKNADGNFVAGSTAGVTAAAEAAVADFPADFRQAPIINGAGADTYPIASYTYLLVYEDQKDATKGQALVSYMAWCLTDGQAGEEALGYAPLPAEIQQKSIDLLHTITSGGSPIWP